MMTISTGRESPKPCAARIFGFTLCATRYRTTPVIAFVSASRRDFLRDYVAKRDEYLRVGVLEYWIIDRFRWRMTVVRGGTDPVTEIVISEHETSYRQKNSRDFTMACPVCHPEIG